MNNYTLSRLNLFKFLLFITLFLGGYQARAQFPYAESFKNSTAPGVEFVGDGTSSAFLTGGAGLIPGGFNDPDGSGYLRLTNLNTRSRSYITSEGWEFPSNYGVNISFEYYSSGGNGGDGFTFILYDGSVNHPTVGGAGGSMAYAQGGGASGAWTGPPPGLPGSAVQTGFQGGYLGVALDRPGVFPLEAEGKIGGFDNSGGWINHSVCLRGKGNGVNGYNFLTNAVTGSGSPLVGFDLSGKSRTATTLGMTGYRKAELELKPRPGGGYFVTVYITHDGTRTKMIDSFEDPDISPATLKFAIAGTNGSLVDYHEIRELRIDVNDPNALVNPISNNDSFYGCAGVPTSFAILANDNGTVNAGGSAYKGSIDLDPATPGIQATYTVAGKGTFTANSTTGEVTFTPANRLITGPVTISYTFNDTYGFTSNVSTITYNVGAPPIVGNTVTVPATTSFTCGTGDPANIVGSSTLSGGDGTFTYEWQKSTDNITFTDIAGATGISYDPAPINVTTYFRRITNSGGCSDSPGSNVVVFTVTNCIDAVNDTFPTQTPGTTAPKTVGNVTTNDTLNGVPVTATNTDVTPVTAGPISIDADGVLTLAPNTPSGSYPITYTICEVNPATGIAINPSNCDSATTTIVVLNPINAVIDTFPTQTPSTTAPTTVGNVTDNDTLNGVPVTAANTDITPVTAGPISIDANGVMTLAPNTPSGSYPITYNICEVNPVTGAAVNPSNCASVTDTVVVLNPINAVIDTFPTQTPSTTVPKTVGNVTTNDTLNGVPVTAANTDVTPVTAGPISIDANGVMTLAPNTPSGSYPITYNICEVNPVTGAAVNPSNCASVTDTVVVSNPINAVIDTFPTQTPSTTVPKTVGNVTTNDTLNGVPVTAANTDVTPVTAGPISIDANGVMTLAPNTPSGSYPITYNICEVNPVTGAAVNPSNCASVTDTVVVSNPINAVIDTFPTQTPSTTVPKTVGNVTTNDTLNGVPVTAANTDVTPVTAGPIAIDANGVMTLAPNTPSGSYPITYNICEVNPVTGAAVNPSNCASVTDTVVVSNPINAVIDTFPTQTPSTTVPKTVGNVTTNDTLNGVPVTAANTDVTPVTAGPISIDANGVMTLAPNTPSGSYPITYNICEVNPVTGAAVNPSNCASVTDTVVVSNPINAVIDTFPTQTPSTTVPKIVGNVTTNDTLNGVPVTAANTDVTPVTAGPISIDANGVLTLAPNTPSGSYPITYNICEVNPVTGAAVNPSNCASATDTVVVSNPINAVIDTFPTQTPSTTAPKTVGNVTTNDTLNGVPVTAANTDVTPVTAGPISIDANGVLTLAPNTPSGSYPITYNICEVNPVTGAAVNPSNCASVTDTVVVLNPINAVIDTFPTQTPSTTLPKTVGNVTTNDTLNGVPVTAANTDVTPVTAGPISIDANGVLTLAPNTPSGSYPITYNICEVNPVTGAAVNPSNCASVTDTVVVLNPIDAVNDTLPSTNGKTGNPAAANVLANDTLNTKPADLTNVNLSVTAPATPIAGGLVPVLNPATGVVNIPAGTPAGTYTITYQICEKASASNCDTATVTIPVSAAAIAANDDTGISVRGTTGGTSFTNVLLNDTLNAVPVVASDVNITFVSATSPGITLVGTNVVVAPGTPGGSYTLTYRICEKLNPTNCDDAIVTIFVESPSMTVTKDGAYVDNNADGKTNAGDTIVYKFVVSNTGNVPLTNVTVTDPNATVSGGPISLAVGASDSTTFVGVHTITQADINAGIVYNLAITSGTPPTGPPVTETSIAATPCATCPVNPACPTCTDTQTPLTQSPSMTVTKDGAYVDNNADGKTNVGDTVVYKFVVSNTGNVPLTNVTVTDPNAIVSGGPISLAVGASDSTTFTAVHTITQADINAGTVYNLAITSGTPPTGPPVTVTSTDPTPCATCPVDPACPTCTDDTKTPLTQSPSMTVTKDGAYVDNNADGKTNVGDTVVYKFVVSNTGNVPLTNVTVTDPNAIVSGGPISLAVGASDSTTFTAVHTITQADINAGIVYNLAITSGTPPTGPPVTETSTDPAPCATCPVNPACPTCTDDTKTPLTQSPSMTVTKDGAYVDNNADGKTNVGDTVVYKFVVSNTGNVPLTNVTVTDPNAIVSGGPISLAVGASDSITFTAVHTITQADINAGTVYNLATTTGTPPTGAPITVTSTDPTPCATCPVDPACPTCTNETKTPLTQSPSMTVTKDGAYVDNNADGKVNVGDTVVYKFVVSNTGNVTLTNVTVTDPNAIVSGGPISLAVGASDSTTFTAVHTVTQADINAGIVYNLATTTGTPPTGAPVTVTSTDPTPCATCPVDPACPTCTDDTKTPLTQSPSIALIKTAEFLDENADGLTQVGETIKYSFTVTNTGNVPLTNITIKDPLPGIVMSGGPISLLPGESDSTSFTGTYKVTIQDLNNGSVSNQATVSGTSPQNGIVQDKSGNSNTSDEATVLTINGCKIEVFNLVSPNGDGANDYLHIEGLDCYPKNSVEIYNRWGVLVYSAEGYNNNEISFKGFSDGRVTIKQSEGLPDGTYYYILKFTDFEGRILSKAGYLYLTK